MNQQTKNRNSKVKKMFSDLREKGLFVKECFVAIGTEFQLKPGRVKNIIYGEDEARLSLKQCEKKS